MAQNPIEDSSKKSKIGEVFCGFACYPSEEVLLDARSQPDNQSPPDAARGKHQTDEARGEQGGKRLSRAA
jgi:hypothetical protein